MAAKNTGGFGTRLLNIFTGKRQFQNAFNQAFYKFVGGGFTAYDTQLSSYIDYGYNVNPIVYAVISQMATKTMSIPFNVMKVKDEKAQKELKNFAYYDFEKTPALYFQKAKMSDRAFEEVEMEMPLKRPNPTQSWQEFWALSKVFLRVTGNIYYYMVTPEDGKNKGVPTQVYVLPSHMIKIIIKNDANFLLDENPILEYGLIEGDSMSRFPAEDVIHVKLPNPNFGESGEHLYGQSPLRAAIKNMQSSNEGLSQNVKMMKNSGSYGFISGKNIPMTQQQADQVKQRLIEMENDTGVLSNYAGVSAEVAFTRLSLTTDELKPFDYLEYDQKQICNVLGWSDKLLNNDAGAKYDNVSQFRKQVVTDNIIPDLTLIADAFEDFLNRFKGYESTELVFHAEQLPEMQQDTEKMAAWMTTLLDRGVISRNEMRTALQFNELDDEEMEVHTVQMNVIPIEMALQKEVPQTDPLMITEREGDDTGKNKAGFDPNQARAANGQWGSGGSSEYKPVTESISEGGERVSVYDKNGVEIAHLNTELVDNWSSSKPMEGNYLLIIDNVFVDENHQRKGLGTLLLDSVLSDWDQQTQSIVVEDVLGNDVYYELPVQIELGMAVSDSGVGFSNSIKEKIKAFNRRQPKPKEDKAGFDPNQPRGEDGQWGSGGVMDLGCNKDFEELDKFSRYDAIGNFDEIREYSKKRALKIDINEGDVNGGELNISVLKDFLENRKIGLRLGGTGNTNFAQYDGDEIVFTQEVNGAFTILHELGEVAYRELDKANKIKVSDDITRALTIYGANQGNDAFSDAFSYYFLQAEMLKELQPKVYSELDKIIPKDYKDISSKIKKESKYSGKAKYNSPCDADKRKK